MVIITSNFIMLIENCVHLRKVDRLSIHLIHSRFLTLFDKTFDIVSCNANDSWLALDRNSHV